MATSVLAFDAVIWNDDCEKTEQFLQETAHNKVY